MESKRKPNWTADETVLLAELVLNWKEVVRDKFGPTITSKEKRKAWKVIASPINAASPRRRRSAEDCEKGWYNVLSTSRKEIAAYKADMQATGLSLFIPHVIFTITIDDIFPCFSF